MTDSTTQDAQPAKTPSHFAYQVRDGNNGKSYWTRKEYAFASH